MTSDLVTASAGRTVTATAPGDRPTPSPDRPAPRRVAGLRARPRPAHAPARRGAAGGPPALPRRVRRAAPARARPRPPAPDERPRRSRPPVAERDHPARRPARRGRDGRARHLLDRRARRGGRAHPRGPRPAPRRVAPPTSTASAGCSSTSSTPTTARPRAGDRTGARRRSAGPDAADCAPGAGRTDRRRGASRRGRSRPGRDERLRLRRLVAAVLPARPPLGRPAPPLRLAPARVRAQQHVLRAPQGGPDPRLDGRRARATSGSSSRPSAARASGRSTATTRPARVAWLTEFLPAFGERLGAVLFRVGTRATRNDERLAGLLEAWPRAIPLVLEAQHPSWHVDETFAALRAAGAVLCTTDLDELEETPDIRRTGPFLYLRLRRTTYTDDELDGVGAPPRPVPRRRARRVCPVPPRRGRHERGPGRGVRGPRRPGARRRLRPPGRAQRSRPRMPSAGPNTTITRSSSVMSWKRCGTSAATKIESPGPTSRVSSPAVNRARPARTT